MTMRRAVFAVAATLALGGCAALPADPRIAWPGPSLTADWVVYQRGDPEDANSAHLSVHREHGMRFDYPATHRNLVAILRFDSTRAWLLDPAQRSYVRLAPDSPLQGSELPGLGRSQVLAPRACPGYSERLRQGVRAFGGRDLEIWECRRQGRGMAIHRYDPALGLVTYEESADGWVNELRNIRVETPDPTLFMLPRDYRKTAPPDAPR